MNVPPDQVKDLRQEFMYNWDNPSISYLEIQLTYPPTKLYEVNYPNPLDQINQDIQSIQKSHYPGCKHLYYFPIPIQATEFTQVNSKLTNLIWKRKKTGLLYRL